MAESLANLDRKKMQGLAAVTQVRLDADARENQRRIAEEERRAERLWRL